MKVMSMSQAMSQYHQQGLSVRAASQLCQVSVPTMLKELKRQNLYEPRLKVPPPPLAEVESEAANVRGEWSEEERKRRWIGNWS